MDSLICPSFRTAVAQTLQLPGISGLPNNCVLLEFDKEHPEEMDETVQGAVVAAESMFNVLVLRSTPYRFGYRSSIDLWVTEDHLENARLMLLLAYIIVGHADWRSARIRLFACIDSGNSEKPADKLSALMTEGRLPISRQDLITVTLKAGSTLENEVIRRSSDTDLLITGLRAEELNSGAAEQALHRYDGANDVLFIYATEKVAIE